MGERQRGQAYLMRASKGSGLFDVGSADQRDPFETPSIRNLATAAARLADFAAGSRLQTAVSSKLRLAKL